MRQMNLKGTLPEVDFISQYIQVPSTCSIRIRLSGTYDDPVAALVPQQRMLQPLLRTCTTFTLSTNHGLADLCMKCGEDYLRMICSVDDFSRLNPETWSALLGASRHSPIVDFRLTLDVVGAIVSEMWMECFSRFPLLDHVALGTHRHLQNVWDATSFLRALASPAADGDSVALTRLRVLELTSVRLDEPTSLNIISMLERRASIGAPLSELVLYHCNTGIDVKSFIIRLQKLVKLSIRYAEE
ncbi:hypothetical protein K466DRAFT_352075 [Polyporus arcularius HHB13444]|uniref:F-box domain-containing protein n=1 Tax=Polyporus arcularius HHB13444 TaxID=1314778 RepID=A0A5C3NWD5_9APHY|nr:hypothetical protein K466DRAFT_352075 [Polyporus arcularius HHB13444]